MINKLSSNIHQLHFLEFSSCVYLVEIKNKKILIDTGSKDAEIELLKDFQELKLNPGDIDIVILTHSHWDHNGNIGLFSEADIYDYKNIDNLPIKQFQICKVPGHTRDSIAVLYKDFLFSGDTLFNNGIGRTDLPESQPEKMPKALETLRNLPYKTLCPGHV